MTVDPRPAGGLTLDLANAMELVDMFTFLSDWLTGSDAALLNASLQRFAHNAYDLADLHADLARFAVLLGEEHPGTQLLPGPS